MSAFPLLLTVGQLAINDSVQPMRPAVVVLLMVGGGVALILFGVRFLRKGLDRLFGARLRHWVQRIAQNRVKAFISGLSIAVVAPSSTTLSALAVQSTKVGHASAKQMLALMFGADLGLTIAVLLLALRLEQFAPILILIGLPFYQFTVAARSRGFGQVIMSLGFIFLGVAIIKTTSGQVMPDAHLSNLFSAAGHYPTVLVIIATVIAVLLQSSTATIAMAIGLSLNQTNLIDMQIAAPVVVGANVGVGITTLLIGWNQLESRRLAAGNLIAKAVTATAVLFLFAPIIVALEKTRLDLPIQIALLHIGFNLVLACIGLPLLAPLNWVVVNLAPDPPESQNQVFGPDYISDSPIDSVALATGQSMREILRVAEIVRQMFTDLWRAIETNDQGLSDQVSNRDDEVDLLDTQIKRFLSRLAAQGLDRDDASEQMRQLRYLNELENIGDIIDKNLSELVTKKIRNRVEFSLDGWSELDSFYQKVVENMLIAETAFSTRDHLLARQLLRHKQSIDQIERDFRDRHFERLNAGHAQSHETSAIHLDLLTHIKRINSCVTHIAYTILQDVENE